MKFQIIVGSLVSLAVTAFAVPVENVTERVVFTGDQLKSMIDVLRTNGNPDILAPDQSITCTVVYALALSAGPPYNIALTSLDLSACTFAA